MDITLLAILAASILIDVVLAFFVVLFKIPKWSEEKWERSQWIKMCSFTAISGVAASILVAYGVRNVVDDLWLQMTGVIATGVMTVTFLEATITDFKFRNVDRRLLNSASIITAIFGIPLLIMNGDWITTSVTIALLVFSAFAYLILIRAVGASDARALALIGVGAVPFIGYTAFVYSSVFAGIFFIIAGGAVFIIKKKNASMPAVPMLIFPYWIMMLIVPFVNFSPVFNNLTQ